MFHCLSRSSHVLDTGYADNVRVCAQLQQRLLLLEKEREDGVEDKLQALQEVKRVLQRELNMVQRENETM